MPLADADTVVFGSGRLLMQEYGAELGTAVSGFFGYMIGAFCSCVGEGSSPQGRWEQWRRGCLLLAAVVLPAVLS